VDLLDVYRGARGGPHDTGGHLEHPPLRPHRVCPIPDNAVLSYRLRCSWCVHYGTLAGALPQTFLIAVPRVCVSEDRAGCDGTRTYVVHLG
jgi:hypothetical protein